MKKSIIILSLLLCSIVIAGIGQAVQARDRSAVINSSILKYYLTPIPEINRGGLTTFELTFFPVFPCRDEMSATVTFRDYTRQLNEQQLDLTLFDKTLGHSTFKSVFQEMIPDNDTTLLLLTLQCDTFVHTFEHCIITTGDKAVFGYIDPRKLGPKPPKTDPDKQFRDTLTSEQLNKEYEVWIDLRKREHRVIAERIVGSAHDVDEHPRKKGIYRFTISMGDLIKLVDLGIDADYVTPPPWDPRFKYDDSLEDIPSLPDSMKKQGFLDKNLSPYSPPGVSLAYVDGMTTPGILPTGQPITFYIRMNNTSGLDMVAIANGFRVYSPDGAEWGGLSADTLNVGLGGMLDFLFFIKLFGADGVGADSAGFSGFRVDSAGLPASFNEISYKLSIGPIDDFYDGYTICLDSSFFGAGGHWTWDSNGSTYYPEWDGPHCFTISNSISFSGNLYYLDPVPPDTNPLPMRRVKIEMWDDDLFPIPDDLLGTAITDDAGFFTLGPVSNSDIVGKLDVFFRIYAENEAAYVTENYNGDIYKLQTSTANDLPSGSYDTAITSALSSSGAFFVADAVLQARDNWSQLRSDLPTETVQVVLKESTDTTHYDPAKQMILIQSATFADMAWPDTFDKDVIFHEYGHFIQDLFNFFDQGGGAHEWAGISDPMVSSSEGFVDFLTNVFNNDPIMINFYPDFIDTAWYNSENGEYGTNSFVFATANNSGMSREGAMAGILWDIYDNNDDDYSTFGVPHSVAPPLPNPDNIGDTLSNGIYNILSALIDRTVDGHRPDNIGEFAKAWISSPTMGHPKAVNDIWYEHGIASYCCNGITGNVDNDPNDVIDIGDVNALIDYLFISNTLPVCMEEANADGDPAEAIDVGDLTALISYLFIPPNPLPASCQ